MKWPRSVPGRPKPDHWKSMKPQSYFIEDDVSFKNMLPAFGSPCATVRCLRSRSGTEAMSSTSNGNASVSNGYGDFL